MEIKFYPEDMIFPEPLKLHFGSIFFVLHIQIVHGGERDKRQVEPTFIESNSVRAPWIPLKDVRPRLSRQDPGFVQDSGVRQDIGAEGSNNGFSQPQISLTRSVGSQSERVSVDTESRARQLSGPTDWIPLAPQLDTGINTLDNRVQQFNPVVTLNTIPGRRLPVTALDPLLFNREQSVVLPSSRIRASEIFSLMPTPVFINQPVTPSQTLAPSSPSRPLPSISVQSIPARVNENGRPVFQSNINKIRVDHNTVNLPTVRSDIISEAVSTAARPLPRSTPKLHLAPIKSSPIEPKNVSVPASISSSEPKVGSFSEEPAEKSQNLTVSRERGQSKDVLSETVSKSVDIVQDMPLILGPNLFDIRLSVTEKVDLVGSKMPEVLVEDPESNAGIASKFMEDAIEGAEKLTVRLEDNKQNEDVTKDLFNSKDGLVKKVKLLPTLNDKGEIEVMPSASEISPVTDEEEHDSIQSEENATEIKVSFKNDPTVNGHQGRFPFVEEKVEIPPSDIDYDSSASEDELQLNIYNTQVINGHQPFFTTFDVEEGTDYLPTEKDEVSDYEISPPGLTLDFREFNVSLIDFKNGTIVLENKTYFVDSVPSEDQDLGETDFNSESPQFRFETDFGPVNISSEEINPTKDSDQEIKIPVTTNANILSSAIKLNSTFSETRSFSNLSTEELIMLNDFSDEVSNTVKITTTTPSIIFETTLSPISKSVKTMLPNTYITTTAIFPVSISSEESNSSLFTTNASAASLDDLTANSSTMDSTTPFLPISVEAETSREFGRQTSPFVTIFNSILSTFTTKISETATEKLSSQIETSTFANTAAASENIYTIETRSPTRQTQAATEHISTSPSTTHGIYVPDSTQEPEPRVSLYLRINVDTTWQELCHHIDDFRSALSNVVSREIGKTISPKQVVIYNIARCAIELHSSRRRRTVSESVAALVYVTDYHGIYSYRLTEALERGLEKKTSLEDFPLARKISLEESVRPSPESLAANPRHHVPATGMIAGITVAVILGLLLLSFLVFLLVVRRRQNRATFARRCQPGSESGIRNSIRNMSWRQSKSQLRASKRSFMNFAYEDPVS
ncbi:uncharacterized protein LOC136025614 [Artemia franciscana]|uniref:uncharacterized protein LOC136025614 n=1 Tax=Artemia franciscana TaxID=6661 RepID=UPI0032DA784A